MKTTIKMPEKFDYDQHNWFQNTIKELKENNVDLEVDFDFANCSYLDSSGLGMLLIAREKVGKTGCRLVNVGGAVMQILKTAHFQRLLAIVEKS